MADDKLGTLEYEMKISEKELTDQLERIDKLLIEQDKKWKKALSNVGAASGKLDTSKITKKSTDATKQQVQALASLNDQLKALQSQYKATETAEIGAVGKASKLAKLKEEIGVIRQIIDEDKMLAAVEKDLIKIDNQYIASHARLENSLQGETLGLIEVKNRLAELNKELNLSSKAELAKVNSIDALKKSLAENEFLLSKMTKEEQRNTAAGQAMVSIVQRQRLAYKEYNDLLNKSITDKNLAAAAAKKLANEIERQQKAQEKLTASQRAAREKQLNVVEALPQGSIERIKEYIKYLEILKRQATTKRDVQYFTKEIASEKAQRDALTASLRQQEIAEKNLVREQKLKIAIESTAVGSVARLRAEIALYVFQLGSIKTKTPEAITEIRRLNAAIAANKQQISALQPTQNLWGKLAGAIRTYVTAYLSVQAAIGLGRAAFRQTKELDQLAFSMKTVIQDSVELARTQKFLSDVAINYGGDLLTLSERYIKFRAAAIQSNVAAEETQKIFDSVSKAAGTLGLKTDELSGVYLALEQMLSKGKVTTEELRRQLGERLPGAFGIMANALGVTIPQLDKMLKKGEVLSTEALPKFAAALEKAYGIESLKKIDTLAAAQGRLSTQFTELIRSVNASDSFKSAINAMADFIGFIRTNISTIGFFAKALLIVVGATTLLRVEQYLLNKALSLGNAVKTAYITLTNKQTVSTIGFRSAAQSAAAAENAAAAATSRWSLAFKAFGGWIGITVNLIITAIAAFAIFGRKTKEVVDAMAELNNQESAINKTLSYASTVLEQTANGTERYKNALQDVNTVAAKYNQELLTESSTRREINESIKETIRLVKEEYLEKRRVTLLEKARTDLLPAEDDAREAIFKFYEDLGEAEKAYDEFLKLQQLVEKGGSIGDAFKLINIGGTYSENQRIIERFVKQYREYLAEIKRIEGAYGTGIKPSDLLDISGLADQLKTAKEEFEKVAKIGKENVAEELIFFDKGKGIESYKDYLNSLLEVYKEKASELVLFEESQFAVPSTDANYDKQVAAYNEYTKKLIADDKTRAKAREQILLELADLEKKTTEGSGKDKRITQLEAQLSLLEKMKDAYDKLANVVSPDLAAAGVLKEFGQQMEDLQFNITPNLDTENFNAVMQEMADVIETFDKKLAQSIREKIAGESTDQTIADVKKIFATINAEIDKFKQADELRKSIFDITGDVDLSVRLTTDTNEVEDIVAYMKGKVEELASASGFTGTFDELAADIVNLTPELQKSITDVQNYVADKSKNILLDALRFIYEGIPEGVDVQFDFSKVIVQLNKSLQEIQSGAQNAIASGVIPEETINKVKQLGIDAVNEVANNAVDKLGANYIKDNLPEQLANDFQNMADASNESIRAIVAEIDAMKEKLRSGDSIKSFFDVSGLGDNVQPIIDSLLATENFDEFLDKIQQLKIEIDSIDKDAEQSTVSGAIVSKDDLSLLNLVIKALEKLGVSLDVAGTETGNQKLKNFAKDAKELGSEISNLIDNVEALSDSLGTGLSESGKNALEAIKSASVGVFNIIEGAAKLTEEKISSVEKASAILAIISAVLKIATAIKTAINEGSEAAREREQAALDYAYEYNKALKERNILLEQAKTIFGTDEYGAATSQLIEMKEAQDDYADSLEKINNMNAYTYGINPDKKWWQFWKDNISESVESDIKILTLVPDLIKDGILNITRAKELISDTNSILTEEQKIILQEAIDANDRYEESLAAFNDYLTSVFGQLGSNLMTAITENLNETMNALDQFTTYASSALEKLFSDLAYTMYLAPIFADIQKQVQDIYTDNNPDDAAQILELFKLITPLVTAGIEGASDFLRDIRDASEAYGFNLFGADGTSAQGLTGAIKGVTEDTARRLEGLMNTIRETTVKNLGNTDSLVRSNELIQAYSGQSLAKLTNIDNNIAAQLALFNSLVGSAGTTGLGGIRVVVQ